VPKKTIRDIPLQGRKALMRVDFNVPLTANGKISNDRRMRCTLPSIKTTVEAGAAAILISHLGRPTGDSEKDAHLRMDSVAARLADLLCRPIRKADQVVGPDVTRIARALKPGEVLVLENLRFHPGEKAGDQEFARELAALGDLYVNDAFGSCHNQDASIAEVPKRFPPGSRVIGLLLERELDVLDNLMSSPQRPMIAVLGGAKVSDKIRLIENLIPRVDQLLIGGAMAYTFLSAQGQKVGNSKVERDSIEVARRLAESAGAKLMLPNDHLIADRPEPTAKIQAVAGDFPDGWFGMDIGPRTTRAYEAAIAQAKTVVWNGPMGKFEDEPFRGGTKAIALAMATAQAVTVVGGGETAEAVEELRLVDRMTHVSTGGGAFLSYLGGERFESLAVIDDR
jgi:phosphoglycerate kinase